MYPFEMDRNSTIWINVFNHRYDVIKVTSQNHVPMVLKPMFNETNQLKSFISQNINSMEYHTNQIERKNHEVTWPEILSRPEIQIAAITTGTFTMIIVIILLDALFHRKRKNILVETIETQVLSNTSIQSINISIGNSATSPS